MDLEPKNFWMQNIRFSLLLGIKYHYIDSKIRNRNVYLLSIYQDQDRISTVERAVKDRVSRLFSTDEAPTSSPDKPAEPPTATSPDKDSGNGSLLESPKKSLTGAEGGTPPSDSSLLDSSNIPAAEAVGRLCALLKPQLEKAHQEVVRRYGEAGGVHVIDLVAASGGQDDKELRELVESQLAILNCIPVETPAAAAAGTTAENLSSQVPSSSSETATSAAVAPSANSPLEASRGDDGSGGAEELAKVIPLAPGSFLTAEAVPAAHKFKLTVFQPTNMKSFVQSVRKEIRLLQSSLPPGITVRGFEERMDLYSAMIEGPKNTPYEDGLFFFDFQLGKPRNKYCTVYFIYSITS